MVSFLYACLTEAGMKEHRSVEAGARGCLMEISIALLTICVILVISISYRNFGDKFACRGALGVGFPVSFLCDYGTGGSPISSWGRIDLADFPFFSVQGLLVDFLFYSVILGIAWLLRRVLRQNESYRVGTVVWVVLLGTAFLIGFLTAAAAYRSERVNFHDYILGIPSPVPATATPFGTPPPPAESPIPTTQQ
jgi:hypothetical protein